MGWILVPLSPDSAPASITDSGRPRKFGLLVHPFDGISKPIDATGHVAD